MLQIYTKKIVNNCNGRKKGFTLVETMVSVSIFVILVTSLTSILISFLRESNRAVAERELIDQTRDVIALVEQDISNAKFDDGTSGCHASGPYPKMFTQTSMGGVSFLDSKGICVAYTMDANILYKIVDGDGDGILTGLNDKTIPITNSNINVNTFETFIYDNDFDTLLPSVTFLLEVNSTNPGSTPPIYIQRIILPSVFDKFQIDEQKYTASDGAVNDAFSQDIAIQGTTMVVGAILVNAEVPNEGQAYVFKYNVALKIWEEKFILNATYPDSGNLFGTDVAIDGDTIVIGTSGYNYPGSPKAGSAHVFEWDGTNWGNCIGVGIKTCTENTRLTASDRQGSDSLGTSITIQGDVIVVGAVGADIGGVSNAGSAYVYKRSSPIPDWGTLCENGGLSTRVCKENIKITASDREVSAQFGSDIDIDLNTIVVSAFLKDDGGSTNEGAVYVFEQVGATTDWGTNCTGSPRTCIENLKLIASDGASGDRLGSNVAIDETNIIASAENKNGDQGKVYLYEKQIGSPSVWGTACNGTTDKICEETLPFTSPIPEPQDLFGNDLDIDYPFMIIGSSFDEDLVSNTGALYIYQYNTATLQWKIIEKLTASDGDTGDDFGASASISSTTIAVGALKDDDKANNAGAVYVFNSP